MPKPTVSEIIAALNRFRRISRHSLFEAFWFVFALAENRTVPEEPALKVHIESPRNGRRGDNMAMNRDGQLKLQKLLDRCMESNTPTKANIVVFSNEKGKILYAGLITDWPMVISSDAEWGEVREMDATKEPFAGKSVKFFSLQQILNYSGCSLLQTAAV